MFQLDEYVKTILQTIRDCKIEDETIVIFEADHGTGVGEKHGEMFYGAFVYDSTANVFSLIHIPKTKQPSFAALITSLIITDFPAIAPDLK